MNYNVFCDNFEKEFDMVHEIDLRELPHTTCMTHEIAYICDLVLTTIYFCHTQVIIGNV